MITEDDLRDTLRAHETLAPDAAPVAARITAGVRTRRHHRYAAAGTALVAAATAAAVAVPTLVLRDPTPAAPVAARSVTPAARPAIRFEPLTAPVTVRWVPPGWFPDGMVVTSPGRVEISYERKQELEEIRVQVWDTRTAGEEIDPAPAGKDVPTSTRKVVRTQLAPHVRLLVAGPLSTADINRLARSVEVRPTALTFPFRATWLPDGYRVTQATTGSYHWRGSSAGTILQDPPGLDTALTLDRGATGTALGIGVTRDDGMWEDKGRLPNGTLFGHPSYYEEEHGDATLLLYDVDGMYVWVGAQVGAHPDLTRAVLERIARGIVLVDRPTDTSTWTTDPL
jgi:hypothetical protein